MLPSLSLMDSWALAKDKKPTIKAINNTVVILLRPSILSYILTWSSEKPNGGNLLYSGGFCTEKTQNTSPTNNSQHDILLCTATQYESRSSPIRHVLLPLTASITVSFLTPVQNSAYGIELPSSRLFWLLWDMTSHRQKADTPGR